MLEKENRQKQRNEINCSSPQFSGKVCLMRVVSYFSWLHCTLVFRVPHFYLMSMLKHSGFRFPQHSSSEGVFDKRKRERNKGSPCWWVMDSECARNWPNCITCREVGSSWSKCDQVCSCLIKFDHVEPSLIQFDHVWYGGCHHVCGKGSISAKSGASALVRPIWTSLVELLNSWTWTGGIASQISHGNFPKLEDVVVKIPTDFPSTGKIGPFQTTPGSIHPWKKRTFQFFLAIFFSQFWLIFLKLFCIAPSFNERKSHHRDKLAITSFWEYFQQTPSSL